MSDDNFNVNSADFNPREFLEQLFHVAVKASVPAAVMGKYMPMPPKGKTIIVGAGKASAQMAKAFEEICAKDPDWQNPIGGLVVTQYGSAERCKHIEIVEASHPVPDEQGFAAAKRILQLVGGAQKDDLVVALISGGGSSLLPYPGPGMDLRDKQHLNEQLLASGAPISKMNAVRKMFSMIKGGRLGVAAYPAPLLTLVISDVPGDDPAEVASGPTIASFSGAKEAKKITVDYKIELGEAARKSLARGDNLPPKPGDKRFASATHQVIASARLSLEAAADKARGAGCEVIVLGDAIEGEAREVGREHGKMIVEKAVTKRRLKPLLILSGGETSVTIAKGGVPGKGGRNSEYLLALALEISGVKNVVCLSADTDGRDGSENNAGVFCDGSTAQRMAAKNVEVEQHLIAHNSWAAFDAVDDLFSTGPTGTNVNDFRATLIY
ncbi:MAG: glycerate kinase [Devosiaceae bacterium]|nr:glycerate kinase [Devosiaceae bacterium]